jgi:hypothetical protein
VPVDATDFLAVRTYLCGVELNEVVNGINMSSQCHSQTSHFGESGVAMIEQITEQ